MRKHNTLSSRDNLDPFVIDPARQANIAKVDELLQSDFAETDVLVIRSDQGCGGTHLLTGIAHALENLEKRLIYTSSYWLRENTRVVLKRKEFVDNLNTSSYLLIDDFSDYSGVGRMTAGPEGKWLGDAIIDFISSGGKVICTHADTDHKHSELLQFLSDFNISEVYLKYPSFEAVEKIAFAEHSPEIVSRYNIKELYEKCTSVRECEGMLISLHAREQLYGLDETFAWFAKWLSKSRR
jgi:hypothetical protein